MKTIQAPFPLFLDRRGDPLDAGQIYIGTVNTNAQTNPISVYWDEAATQPAAQPLRTSMGYIVNGVTRARAYVNADDFSVLVKDKAGTVVDSVMSAEAEGGLRADLASTAVGKGAALVGAIDGSGGAIFTTVAGYISKMLSTSAAGLIKFSNGKTLQALMGTGIDNATLTGLEDGTGAVRKALVIGPGTDPTGVICFDGDVFGDYQPNPPSGPYGFHFTEDKSNIDMTGATNAYASHSITCEIVGSSDYDHFKAVQAWPSYTSSGNMNDFDVIDTYPNHSGTGTITNLRHFRVKGNLGSGPITNEYGLYIDGINRGSALNYAIFSISGAPSHHYGALGVGPGTSGVTAGLLVGGGQVRTIGVGGYFEASNSLSRFGPADQFIGSTGATDTGISTFNDLHFAVSSTSMVKLVAAGHWMPTADNVKNLGGASNRWNTVYAGTGTINTSDARSKQQIRSLSTAEKAVAVRLKALVKAFKFNEAVAEKGAAARIHVGWIAQEVKAAFEAEGLVATAYGVLCYDEWPDQYVPIHEPRTETDEHGNEFTTMVQVGTRLATPAGNRYGVRHDELVAFIIGAM
jgi:Chaperone of endosialidase/Catalytic domain of bacteriophage endosialidase